MLFFDERFAPCEALLDGEKERCGITAPTNREVHASTDKGFERVTFCKHHAQAYDRLAKRREMERKRDKIKRLRVLDENEVRALTPQEIC